MSSNQHRNLQADPADAEAVESLIHMTAWARQQAMAHAVRRKPFAGPIDGAGAPLVRAWRAWRRGREIARAAAHLSALDDHALQDIGIRRADIARAARHGRNWQLWR